MPSRDLPRPIALLALAVACAGAGLGLLTAAADRLGDVLNATQARSGTTTFLLLAGGLVLEAAAVAAGGLAGVEMSAARRRAVMRDVLGADPDLLERFGAGEALSFALDADLVGSALVTAASGLLLGVVEITLGIGVTMSTESSGPRLLVVVATGVSVAAVTISATGRRSAWAHARAVLSGSLAERLVGQRTVALQETDADLAAHESEHARYVDCSRALDRATLALRACVHVGVGSLVLLAAARAVGPAPGSDAARGVLGALVLGVGAERLRQALVELIIARAADQGLSSISAMAAIPPHREVVGARTSDVLVCVSGVAVGIAEPCGPTATDLVVRRGDRVLIEGASGSGKTMLVEAIDGRRMPLRGRVELAPGAIVRRVPQAGDDHLFRGSLLANIVGGVAWPPTSELEQDACSLVEELGLGSLVARMPAGMLQPVGNGGWRLSAGEMARVSLARALVGRPDVVILDETVAALDAATRELALAAARRWAAAVVVVAHP